MSWVASFSSTLWQDERAQVSLETAESARKRARGCGPHRDAKGPDHVERMEEADSPGRYARLTSDASDLDSDEIVGDGDAIDFLPDTSGRLAAKGFAAIQQMRFEFIVSDLEFPALVVEQTDLFGRILNRVEQRGDDLEGLVALRFARNHSGDNFILHVGMLSAQLLPTARIPPRPRLAQAA